jgi:hypothetical protein
MAFIPPNAKWFLAEIVLEFSFSGHNDNTVHTNWILIRADSPDDAYTQAEKLGQAEEDSYVNPDGETVTVQYRGLRDLNVIEGDLVHGTELTYEKRVGMSEAELEKWVSRKADLSVFRPDPTGADDGDERSETANQGP